MNFKKVNNITGWAVFLVALATYMLTREARGSLWDCGEFVASADKMQLPHPPGAPLFVLLGRFFIILFGDKPLLAANAVNFMSALASAATILFLFWCVTHFGRKLFVGVGETLNNNQLFATMAAGVVGALAYTFSDSFWYSAVEGEVYALSSFFTAIVFWVMLKWEHADEQAGIDVAARVRSDRWIVLLFFLMGLSIGVHLLNLLTIPAIVMIYYYRRYAATTKGAIWAFLIGCIITGLVQVVIIQYSMKAAGLFDIYFVNSFGMGFFSGFTIYFILLAAVIGWGLTLREKSFTSTKAILFFVLFLALSLLPFFITPGSSGGAKFAKFLLVGAVAVVIGYFIKANALRILKLSLWCYAFMMLGYFVYFSALIRSNANPAIDMNNIDNPINLVYYLSREQYGSAPLVYGPHFAANPSKDLDENEPIKEGEQKYIKGKNADGSPAYIATGRAREYNYKSSVMQLFPRVWDSSDDQYHASFYAQWLDLREADGTYRAPGLKENVEWFFSYQMGMMYWRYFMWNFAGKQNDLQSSGGVRDGNWISGISFLDNNRLGDQSKIPDSIKHNKANNKLFMLPFILGIIGCVYQYFKNRKDWIVSFLLFFFTGIAVVLYLNQPGNQPRERDYAYVGSFFAFAIWIGLSVIAFVRLAMEKADKLTLQNVLTYGSGLTFLITLMSSTRGTFGSVLITGVVVTALFALVTYGGTMLVRAVSSGGSNFRTANLSAGILCLLVPILMGQQEWDDHDRSSKLLAPDLARDYLESCAPNAIIFTFGDNDTYPLWYAQEVENVRPDIRIINNSLLGIDWYINQLRYKINQADGVDVIWTEEQIEGHNREFMRYKQDERANPNNYYSLYDVMKNVLGKPARDPETGRDVGAGNFPVGKFRVDVDVNAARASGLINANDSAVSPMLFEIPQNKLNGGLVRNDMIILNIIAANNWKRPIYFTSPFGELGFAQYLRKDGLAYRLVPVQNKFPQNNWETETVLRNSGAGGTQLRDNNTDTMYNNIMTKFRTGGAGTRGTYFDEENRRHLIGIRSAFAEAAGNMADLGRKEEAGKLLDKAEKEILAENMPYAMVSRFSLHNQGALIYLEAAFKAGRKDISDKLRKEIRKDLTQQKAYYDDLKANNENYYSGQLASTEAPLNELMLMVLDAIEKRYDPATGGTPPPIEGGAAPIIMGGKDSMPKTDTPGTKP
ncbi:MAG: MFS transporter [Chitinophagaceae bacterium]|nr:MAG: MFS transporter [Chitinophagaceae bacterium]